MLVPEDETVKQSATDQLVRLKTDDMLFFCYVVLTSFSKQNESSNNHNFLYPHNWYEYFSIFKWDFCQLFTACCSQWSGPSNGLQTRTSFTSGLFCHLAVTLTIMLWLMGRHCLVNWVPKTLPLKINTPSYENQQWSWNYLQSSQHLCLESVVSHTHYGSVLSWHLGSSNCNLLGTIPLSVNQPMALNSAQIMPFKQWVHSGALRVHHVWLVSSHESLKDRVLSLKWLSDAPCTLILFNPWF